MIVYHASPNSKIIILRKNSYVSIFPHVSYNMGLYHESTGKTWNDNDLASPYGMEPKIKFKRTRKATGIPTLYKILIEPEDIIMHSNFPYEFTTIKKPKRAQIISGSEISKLLSHSVKMYKNMELLNFDY